MANNQKMCSSKLPFATIFAFIGSVAFFIGALCYIIDPNTPAGIPVYFVCSIFFVTASSIQLGCDLHPKKPQPNLTDDVVNEGSV